MIDRFYGLLHDVSEGILGKKALKRALKLIRGHKGGMKYEERECFRNSVDHHTHKNFIINRTIAAEL